MKKHGFIILILFTSAMIFAQEQSEAFKPEGKISGYAFGDYFYNIKRDANISDISNAAQKGEEGLHGVQFRRIYVTYDYKISPRISSRFRVESKLNADEPIGLIVKDAYLKIKVFEGSALTVGLSPTPTFELSEKIWGHRYLEKTIADLRKISSSRDIGIKLSGKINSMLKYAVMYGSGNGTKLENDKFKRYYGHLQINPVSNLTITLYADVNNNIRIDDAFDTTNVKLKNNVITPGVFVAYAVKDKFTVGIESFSPVTQNGIEGSQSYSDKKGLAVSAFAHANLTEKLGAVCRYDYYDPNLDTDDDLRQYILAGLSYNVHDKVTVTPNLVAELYEKDINGVKKDPSITGRLTLYYKF